MPGRFREDHDHLRGHLHDSRSDLHGLLAYAWVCVGRFRRRPLPASATLPPGPCSSPCAAPTRIYESLRTFCEQDYPEFQIVFGVRTRRIQRSRSSSD